MTQQDLQNPANKLKGLLIAFGILAVVIVTIVIVVSGRSDSDIKMSKELDSMTSSHNRSEYLRTKHREDSLFIYER